ncbi:MAG: PaaI family thioesterase [Pseudomonadota bacterium]
MTGVEAEPLFEPQDEDFAARVAASFARQSAMTTLGATLDEVTPGAVAIAMPFAAHFGQQHGFMHAGAVTTLLDSACGYAALSLMAVGSGVLTIEFKASLLAPAAGDRFVARGRVVKAGRAVMFCEGVATAYGSDGAKQVATLSATMMVVRDRPKIEG